MDFIKIQKRNYLNVYNSVANHNVTIKGSSPLHLTVSIIFKLLNNYSIYCMKNNKKG
nr:MAG TPA: hypothetical protein [Caudoviricetes sp.]